jgi:hypothetical protein
MEEEKKDSGFVVKDKRLFDESGKERSQEEAQSATAEEKPKVQKSSPTETKQESDYPQVTFTNFVLSLSTSALFHFGDFPDPEGGKTEKTYRRQNKPLIFWICSMKRLKEISMKTKII